MLIPGTSARGISGVYHHYANGARPNEMNSKNPSPPPTLPDGTEEAVASGPGWRADTAPIDRPGPATERTVASVFLCYVTEKQHFSAYFGFWEKETSGSH